MLLWLLSSSVLTVVSAQLRCQPETLSYTYVNTIGLWGTVDQRFQVSCNVDIDCEGESVLSTEASVAFDYVFHMYNVSISEGAVQPKKAARLCKQDLDPSYSCTVGESSTSSDARPVIIRATEEFDRPVRFTQGETGTILRVEFMEKDMESHEVMDMKKGIISALQTKISGGDDVSSSLEVDSTGLHTSHYRSRKVGKGVVISKDYKVDYDATIRSRLAKVADVRVTNEIVVENGEILSSSGELTGELEADEVPVEEDSPDDIAADISIDEIVRSSSTFQLKLSLKSERSAVRKKRMTDYRRLTFLPSSLKMDSLDNSEEYKYEKLSILYDQLESTNVRAVVVQFLVSGDEQELKIIRDIISLETELGYDRVRGKLETVHERPLVDTLVKETFHEMANCEDRWHICREILELYTLGGGRKAEQVFEYVLSSQSNITDDQQIEVTNLAAFMTNPSDRFVLSLVHLQGQMSVDDDSYSSLLLTLGSLAGQTSVSDSTKYIVRSMIMKELESLNPEKCVEDVRHADALEAIGNMGDVQFLDRLLEINAVCRESRVTRIAIIHAMRGFLEDSRVQSIFLDTLSSFDCEVSQDMVNLLNDEIQEQSLDENSAEKWPLVGFNDFDHTLAASLMSESEHLNCLRKDAVRYFRSKLSPEAREVTKEINEAYNKQKNHVITKRGLKKHSSCSSWADHGRYTSIALKGTFKSDNKKYKKKSHCLAHFGLGPSKANINIYAGYFAGYTSATNSKVLAKIVAKGRVFKKKFNLATVYVYFQGKSGRIYAKVGKKTLIDKKLKTPSYKSTSKLFKAPKIKIPLGKIPVFTATINLDVTLSATVSLTTHLRICSKPAICLSFLPKALAKITGTASLSLKVVRGGAEVAVNLNYYVKGNGYARVKKRPCVSLYHGHDANNIKLYFFYQIRSKVKVKLFPPKIKFKWGKKKTWKPSSLTWKIGKAKSKKIYSNC